MRNIYAIAINRIEFIVYDTENDSIGVVCKLWEKNYYSAQYPAQVALKPVVYALFTVIGSMFGPYLLNIKYPLLIYTVLAVFWGIDFNKNIYLPGMQNYAKMKSKPITAEKASEKYLFTVIALTLILFLALIGFLGLLIFSIVGVKDNETLAVLAAVAYIIGWPIMFIGYDFEARYLFIKRLIKARKEKVKTER